MKYKPQITVNLSGLWGFSVLLEKGDYSVMLTPAATPVVL